jgi:hypothetical protein
MAKRRLSQTASAAGRDLYWPSVRYEPARQDEETMVEPKEENSSQSFVMPMKILGIINASLLAMFDLSLLFGAPSKWMIYFWVIVVLCVVPYGFYAIITFNIHNIRSGFMRGHSDGLSSLLGWLNIGLGIIGFGIAHFRYGFF